MTYSVNVKTNSHEVKLMKIAHTLLVDRGIIRKQDLTGNVSVSVSKNTLTVECNTYAEEFVCIKCEIDSNGKLHTNALKVSGGIEVEEVINIFTLLKGKAKVVNTYRYTRLMKLLQLTYDGYLDITRKSEYINELEENLELLKRQFNNLENNTDMQKALFSARQTLKSELYKLKK